MSDDAEEDGGGNGSGPVHDDGGTSRRRLWNLSPQWIAMIGALGAAFVSAVVSFTVTMVQTNWEREKSLLESKVEYARIFQELVNKASASDDPSFVILALSKVFPEDEKLIVTTAMMNPNLHTASTLNAIGADKNLEDYLKTIKGIIVNATTDRRRAFNDIYGEKFPKFVMEVNYEAAVRSGGDEAIVGDLIGSVSDPVDLTANLRVLIANDPRVMDNPRLRARLVRVLYTSDDVLMDELLNDAAQDPALAEEIARQYAKNSESLDNSVKDRLIDVALDYLQSAASDTGNQRNKANMMLLVTKLEPGRNLSPEQNRTFVQLLRDFYVDSAQRERPFLQALLMLETMTADDSAEKLYFKTLACLPGRAAEDFYHAFPTSELKIADWDDTQPFDGDLVGRARSRLTAEYEDCDQW